ncbi:MAG TPA: ASPIC/UnbV domain-containing protein, partial [Candidatus Angelobacter sp.]
GNNHGLRIKLIGTKSNRDGIGASVRVKKGSDMQYQMLHGGGYLSQNELVLTFGLGQATTIDSVDIDWPSGQHDHLMNVAADQLISVEEGRGITANRKFNR